MKSTKKDRMVYRNQFPVVDMEATGKAIAFQRKQKRMTATELARILNISYTAVYKWERGLALPSIDSLIILSSLFRIPVDSILVRKPVLA